jgi:hypothetical protein
MARLHSRWLTVIILALAAAVSCTDDDEARPNRAFVGPSGPTLSQPLPTTQLPAPVPVLGTVNGLRGACPVFQFSLAANPFDLFVTDAGTTFTGVSCRALRNRLRVRVHGRRLIDGRTMALIVESESR